MLDTSFHIRTQHSYVMNTVKNDNKKKSLKDEPQASPASLLTLRIHDVEVNDFTCGFTCNFTCENSLLVTHVKT